MEATVDFIDVRRGEQGVEPICGVPPIAPSTYPPLAKRAGPARRSDRARRDEGPRPEIRRAFGRAFEGDRSVRGVRKVRRPLRREGFDVARRTAARLTKGMDSQGAVRGAPHRATIPDKARPRPSDRVNRQFRAPAPNRLRVSDFTCAATRRGFVRVAFVLGAHARRIVGRPVSTTPGFLLDALEQAVHERRPAKGMGPVRHSDRGGRHLSIECTERLAEAGIEPSGGGAGDSCDNALAETIDGLFKAGANRRRGPRRSVAVECATLGGADWLDTRRPPGPIGNVPPADAEANHCAGPGN